MSLPHRLPDLQPQDDLRAEFARANATLTRTGAILGHLLSTPDHSLFSDEIVARVRGMIHDLAWQILRAQAEATGQAGREEFADRHGEALAGHLQTHPPLLAHCHALALEWQLTTRLEANAGIDPVLSPLLQDLVASPDSATASAAMAALVAQARFAQSQKRMELPLSELPADLFHETLLGWRAFSNARQSDALVRAEARLRNGFDESTGRLALLARLVAGLGTHEDRALSPVQAGGALFLTALAARSGQSREKAILSTNERQLARLALGLRAANLSEAAIGDIAIAIHPDILPPRGLEDVSASEARHLLVESESWGQG